MTIIEDRSGVTRRFGFVALLLGIACITNLMDAVRNSGFSPLRIGFMVVTGFLSLFFAYTWWKLKKGSEL